MKNDHGAEFRAEFLGKPVKQPPSRLDKWFNRAIAVVFGAFMTLFMTVFLLNLDTFGPAVVHPTPVKLLASLPSR